MASINWNNGQLISLSQGDTATCSGNLNPGQLYALFFYNAAGNDADTTVMVTANGYAPVSVRVPGTTANQGLAALCFVSGNDTSTISAAVLNGQPGASVQAFIGSVKMPMDGSINNVSLPLNGSVNPFEKFTRYYAVPQSHWYNTQITSNINAFTCVLFKENTATVYVVNTPVTGVSNVSYYGPSSQAAVTIKTVPQPIIADSIFGDGSQYVWINADSAQNSQTAAISAQSLQSLF